VNLLICQGSRILSVVEIKSSRNIVKEQLEGLRRFQDDNPKVPAFVLGHKQNLRQLAAHITLMNWDDFIMDRLERL